MGPSPSLPAGPGLARSLWRNAFLGSLFFIIYGSLVPLDFQPVSWDQAFARFVMAEVDGAGSRVDWASNVLLAMPAVFSAAQWLLPGQGRTGAWLLRGLLVLGMFGVSLSVEFAQIFFPPRTVSWSDIQAQMIGALLALGCQLRWGPALTVWLLGWWRAERRSARLVRVLKAYLLVMAGFSLLPLDLTLNPVEVYHKWSEGRVILQPFGGLKGSLAENLYECLTDVLLWLPVGVLMRLSGVPLSRVVMQGALLAGAIELAQLFVFSRVTDLTDVLLAVLGVTLGGMLARWLDGDRRGMFDRIPAQAWWSGWWLWLLLVLLVFWFPYNFQAVPPGGWSSWLRVPFSTYQLVDEYKASNELLRRMGFFLPGGLLWGLAVSARARGWGVTSGGRGWLPLLLAALLVEMGQIFLPGKVADLTDAVLAFLGGLLGLRLAAWLVLPGEAAPAGERSDPGRPPRPPVPGRAGGWIPHGLLLAGLVLGLMLVVRLPGVPYNLRELVAVGPVGFGSALALAVCAYLLANGPAMLAGRSPALVLAAPLGGLLSGTLAFLLLRIGVPLESLHDVLGSPVLGWPWEWELLGRFVILWVALSLQVGLAFLMVDVLLDPRRLPVLLNGFLVSALLAWPLYEGVVTQAATDNLTELLASGASFGAVSCLAIGLMALAAAGSALSALLAPAAPRRRLALALLLAAGVAPWAVLAGLETTIIKYDQVFSALQFLLSRDRSHYVGEAELMVRLALALVLLVLGLALLQSLYWRRAVARRAAGGQAGRP